MVDSSDAGGVAARFGFKYQDHIAAHFALKMIGDRRILQVECETSDDIAVLYEYDGILYPEYIQVKTTDRDNKWNLTELLRRTVKGKPTSICEKSLLCDNFGPNARFRIISRRSVGRSLACLLEPIALRTASGELSALAARIKADHPETLSGNGHDLAYWTQNLFWDVHPEIDSIENKNIRILNELAEEYGANLPHSFVLTSYRKMLELVDKAALATRSRPEEKTITRDGAISWWQAIISEARDATKKTAKPYVIRGDKFFIDLHKFEHKKLKRYSSSYDAQFERKVWRSRQLGRYLSDWIPEVALRASDLVQVDHLHLKQKIEAGLRQINSHIKIDVDRILGETLLHCVLRHHFHSEPIACKLFSRSFMGDRVTKNAHIVPQPTGDQLWLGRVRLLEPHNISELSSIIVNELSHAIDTDLLSEERDIILQLQEPQHLTSNSLNDALERGNPIDDLIKILCLPLLIAYDSQTLSLGHTDDYRDNLLIEVQQLAESCMLALPCSVEEVRVHIFLIPIEKIATLKMHFIEQAGMQ